MFSFLFFFSSSFSFWVLYAEAHTSTFTFVKRSICDLLMFLHCEAGVKLLNRHPEHYDVDTAFEN